MRKIVQQTIKPILNLLTIAFPIVKKCTHFAPICLCAEMLFKKFLYCNSVKNCFLLILLSLI
ncbi:hypothetical protein CG401_05700 [Bifidobacteriaceae bacterium NR019]|nr:hypothetical protein CG401_05700 [Bifidobacteriaceae bacterium NR019]RFT33911.1 hypothetical protein CG400_05460 [Bifidobacteriaceae bacterium NR017]